MTLIVLTACHNQNVDPRIETFESFLGEDNSELLSEKVKSFELFLKMNFNDLSIEKAYLKYLKSIEDGEFEYAYWKYDGTGYTEINKLIEESGLRREIWLKPDTVWIVDGKLYYEYTYFDSKDTFLTQGNSLFPEDDLIVNQDSIIKTEKQPSTFNINGKYIRGLELVKDNDSAIITYIDNKHALINVAPTIVAGELLYYKADFSDYFIKRIIAIELY